jgi:hypothetical protein
MKQLPADAKRVATTRFWFMRPLESVALPKDTLTAGSWRAVDPTEAAKILASSKAPWWIAGGWALDLFRGTPTRPHVDLDVGVLRRDLGSVLHRLSTWEVFEAKDGHLTQLGAGCVPPLDVHSLWCRPIPAGP